MHDETLTPFEVSLQRRLRAHAAVPVAQADSLGIARGVMVEPAPRSRTWWPLFGLGTRAQRVAQVAIAVALLAATIGTALYVASLLSKPPLPVRLITTSAPPAAAYGLPVDLADGRVLLIGSRGGTTIYDPTSSAIIPTGSLNEARGVGTLAVRLLDGRVLVAGGFTPGDGESRYLTSAEVYDPATGAWRQTGPLTRSHVNCCGDRGLDIQPLREARARVLDDGRVLVAGGDSTTADLFDPRTGSFTAIPIGCMPSGDMLLLRDGRVLVTCITSRATEIRLFDPTSNTFSSGARPPVSGAGHLSLLPDGRVLVSGWVLRADADAQVYDPVHDRFETLRTTSNPAGNGSAFTLEDGRVFFVERRSGWVTVFDPATMTFQEMAATAPASIGRMVALADGRIFAQGSDDVGDYAWVIDPAPAVATP